jgi:hypothetical protein
MTATANPSSTVSPSAMTPSTRSDSIHPRSSSTSALLMHAAASETATTSASRLICIPMPGGSVGRATPLGGSWIAGFGITIFGLLERVA